MTFRRAATWIQSLTFGPGHLIRAGILSLGELPQCLSQTRRTRKAASKAGGVFYEPDSDTSEGEVSLVD
jgi:hypothetical protein